jgi:hypothetical protein
MVQMIAITHGLAVSAAAPMLGAGAVPPATLSWFPICRIALVPVSVIPDTRSMHTSHVENASPVQSNVQVIDDGEPGTSWSATKHTSSSPLLPFTANVDDRVNVMEFADAVSVPRVVVSDANTSPRRKSLAEGVNDPDASDVVFVVVFVETPSVIAATAIP